MFQINNGQGMAITFANGITISIQSSKQHYCIPGQSAEIAIWDKEGNDFEFQEGRNCEGWQTPNEVAEWINRAAKATDITNV